MFRISLRGGHLVRPVGPARVAGFRFPVPIWRALGAVGLTLALLGLAGSRGGPTPANASAIDRAPAIDTGSIGGSGDDNAVAIALSGKSKAYVAGATSLSQTSFPVYAGPDLTNSGGGDALVAKISVDESPTPEPGPTATIVSEPIPNPSVSHIPVISKSYCIGDFSDQFDDPLSGWTVKDNSWLKSEYVGGEFRLVSKQSGFFFGRNAPTCARFNYVVETTARWVGTPGAGYGVRFGISDDYSHWYGFMMNTDLQLYWMWKRTPAGGEMVVPIGFSSAIARGNGSNSIKVTRNGSAIALQVGSTVLAAWQDSSILGLTRAGVIFTPHTSNPVAEVRFNNFKVTTIFNGAEQTRFAGIASGAAPGSNADFDRDFAPDDLSWELPEPSAPSE